MSPDHVLAERVPLGRSGLTVPRVGLGTAACGGLYAALDDATAARTLTAAWQAGIRFFDTAPHYGVGLAERRLGTFLAGQPRAEVLVSTKVGRLLRAGEAVDGAEGYFGTPPLVRVRDYSEQGVYASVAESLERTGLDAFDILLIHDPDDYWEQAVGEAYPALDRLRAQGAVKAIGVGMNQAEMLTRFVTRTDVDCVLVAGRYTLLDRAAATELLPACQRRGVGVLVGGVFNSGVLADPTGNPRFDYGPATEEVRRRVAELAERCAAHGVPLAAAAAQFPLRHPAVSAILLGARTPEEIAQNRGYLEAAIPDTLWAELDA